MQKYNDTYNGWSNYETWVTKLWIDNEQKTYNDIVNLTKRHINKLDYQLGDIISGYVDKNMLPEIPPSLASDLLRASMTLVNWTEIAKSYKDDIK
jgi:hypothetical protein